MTIDIKELNKELEKVLANAAKDEDLKKLRGRLEEDLKKSSHKIY